MINEIKKINLNNWILIAMVLGFIVGMALNLFRFQISFFKDTLLVDNIFHFGGTAFINLMKMLVVPLVFCSIMVGTASIINTKKIGNITIEIIVLYLATTLIAVCLGVLHQYGVTAWKRIEHGRISIHIKHYGQCYLNG